MSERFHEILKQYWGYDTFRDQQEEIIQSVYSRCDTLGLLPTGGGKSITFQVPAMTMDGTCLVITPLIALMKDQVINLQKRGIKATALYAGMTRNEIEIALENCIYGNYKFLYLSPERLETKLFLSKLPHLNVSFITVDEAHCISQWGYDFRPSYLNIGNVRELLPNCPVLALTATATPLVVKDLMQKLLFKRENIFSKSFKRSNLTYTVEYSEDKYKRLLEFIKKYQGSTVIYVRNRKKTKELADFLVQNGCSASYFHAGLDRYLKDERQQQWTQGSVQIMVSTNAFGMGIDKPDVRLVVHFDIPDSPEAYYQEAGRAGRDGKPSVAVTLFSKTDVTNLKKGLTNAFPPKDLIKSVYDHLMNYFQVAVENGKDRTFNFEIGRFCKAYKLNIIQVHNSLKILERCAYLQNNDSREDSSRLMILANKDELFNFQANNNQHVNLIKTILRSYSGLFTSFVFINEATLGSRTDLSRDQVYQQLSLLDKAGLIKYIPQSKTPTITLITDRIPAKRIIIDKAAYEHQKEKMEERVNTMLYYVSSNTICRSQILLSYFGEKHSKSCGRCDVCNNQNSKNDFQKIRNDIQQRIEQQNLLIEDLLQTIEYPREKIIETIRIMHDNEEIILQGKQILRNF